ncbi:hypothetical protein IFM89_032399 [Coptis chinensis]|uniref:FCP1 homology domain-containing protein n=1 Tax=Coptis chinensis TaxID=261450 RepID=A0A835LW48_9MAGN|nr:hypothetical protein IFM89_032399 [Coptis chinensis]
MNKIFPWIQPLQVLVEHAKRRKCSVEDRQPLLIEGSGPCAKRRGDGENSSDNDFVQPPKRRAITQSNTPELAEKYHRELDLMTLADGVNMLLQNPDDIVHPLADETNFEIEDTTIEEDLDVNTTDGKVGKQWYTSKSRQWNKFSHLEEAIYTICEDKIHAKFDEIPLVVSIYMELLRRWQLKEGQSRYKTRDSGKYTIIADTLIPVLCGCMVIKEKLNLVRLADFIMPEKEELVKLWDKNDPNLPWERREYNESNTVMLDDSPYKALFNSAHTAIFPTSYDFQNENDNSLGPGGDIRMYLEGLATSKNVQKYIEQHPFGQQALTESDPSWPHYLQLINSRLHAPSDPGL